MISKGKLGRVALWNGILSLTILLPSVYAYAQVQCCIPQCAAGHSAQATLVFSPERCQQYAKSSCGGTGSLAPISSNPQCMTENNLLLQTG